MVKDLTVSNDTIENADAPLYHDFKDELEDILAKIDITKNQLKQELGLIHDIDELTAFRLSNTKRIKRGTNTIGKYKRFYVSLLSLQKTKFLIKNHCLDFKKEYCPPKYNMK
jgi:hypothetical protein